MTKDHDFLESRMLKGTPKKLCIVRLGNVDNDALIALVTKHKLTLETALQQPGCVEFGRDFLVVHP
jgi:predicted nuclease of predicted toxin-antitoxin system